MATSERECRLRAELAAELGYFPASLAPEDIARHRRLNAALDKAPTRERVSLRYAHLSELKRQSDVEAQGLAEIAELYE